MENTDVYIGPEPHIEVHKYYAGVVPLVVVLALVLQAFFPVHFRWAGYLELPLLITLYFALSKRNPSTGLLLGMVIEHPIARFLLTIVFYLFHHAVFALTSQLLLAQHGESYINIPILIASVVNAFIAIALFPLLDRFRRPS
jgi:rod shape-determining protein MreD